MASTCSSRVGRQDEGVAETDAAGDQAWGASLDEALLQASRATSAIDRDRVALQQVPSTVQSMQRGIVEMALSEGKDRWHDPVLGLEGDLSSLKDTWEVQLNRQGIVRWWAKHEKEGALAQLTIEPDQPLGPDVDSARYAHALGAALARGTQGAAVPTASRADVGLGLALTYRVDGESEALHVWHWHLPQRGALVTLSVRSPRTTSDRFASVARALAGELRVDDEMDSPSLTADEGTIEYRIEEE